MQFGKRWNFSGWHIALWSLAMAGGPLVAKAEEHCLVVQAMALAGYKARMELLQGTDDVFNAAYLDEQAGYDRVTAKYKKLFEARDVKGGQENPENHGSHFNSQKERDEYFNRWTNDTKALEADQLSEMAVYTDTFDRAIAADPNASTRRRLAIVNAKWNKESHLPCYWGQPK